MHCQYQSSLIKIIVMNILTSPKKEGRIAKAIEKQTAKLPSDLFLWSAAGTLGISVTLKLMGKKHESLLVGQWVAPLLILGLYNKIVKLSGRANGFI
jgi:hypothetical protein